MKIKQKYKGQLSDALFLVAVGIMLTINCIIASYFMQGESFRLIAVVICAVLYGNVMGRMTWRPLFNKAMECAEDALALTDRTGDK